MNRQVNNTNWCVFLSEEGQNWSMWWLVAYSESSHHTNQCWLIVNWTLRNKIKFLWKYNDFRKKMHWKYCLQNICHHCSGLCVLIANRTGTGIFGRLTMMKIERNISTLFHIHAGLLKYVKLPKLHPVLQWTSWNLSLPIRPTSREK